MSVFSQASMPSTSGMSSKSTIARAGVAAVGFSADSVVVAADVAVGSVDAAGSVGGVVGSVPAVAGSGAEFVGPASVASTEGAAVAGGGIVGEELSDPEDGAALCPQAIAAVRNSAVKTTTPGMIRRILEGIISLTQRCI